MKAAILILVLLAITQATKTSTGTTNFLGVEMNFSSRRSFLALLTQVESKLKMGSPLDTITKLLDDFKTAITEEQVSHDVLHDRQAATCEEELSFREAEVADATGALNAATELFEGCTSQELRAEDDARIAKKQLREARNYVAVLEDNRRREQENYQWHVDVLQEIINDVEEIIIKLEEMLGGEGEFVQIVKKANKMLKSAVQVGKGSEFYPVLQVFVAISSKAAQDVDEVVINRAQTQLKHFLEQLQDTYEETVNDEDAAVAAYNEEHGRVDAIIENLEQTEEDLANEIQRLTKCIVTQSGIVNSSKAKLDRNSQLQEDAGDLCDINDQEYEASTKARKAELKLLAALRERVDERFGEMSEGARNFED